MNISLRLDTSKNARRTAYRLACPLRCETYSSLWRARLAKCSKSKRWLYIISINVIANSPIKFHVYKNKNQKVMYVYIDHLKQWYKI